MADSPRPLSPHLQVYRFHFTTVLSGLHRMTGVALGGGALLLTLWLAAAAAGPAPYAAAQAVLGSWLGRLVLLGFTWAFFYHLCNGVRHLAWDAGWGFDVTAADRSGYAVVAASAALTLLAWSLAYMWRP